MACGMRSGPHAARSMGPPSSAATGCPARSANPVRAARYTSRSPSPSTGKWHTARRSARGIAVHAASDSLSPARSSLRRTASGMNSSVSCRSPSSWRRRYIAALYVRGRGDDHHAHRRRDAQRAEHGAVRTDSESPHVEIDARHAAAVRFLEGELAAHFAPVQRERAAYAPGEHFRGNERDLRISMRLEHVADDVALDLGAVPIGESPRVLVAAAHRGHHPHGSGVESRHDLPPIGVDLEPLDAQLEIVADAGKDAFTLREYFARRCSWRQTCHTPLSLSDHGLDRIVGIA